MGETVEEVVCNNKLAKEVKECFKRNNTYLEFKFLHHKRYKNAMLMVLLYLLAVVVTTLTYLQKCSVYGLHILYVAAKFNYKNKPGILRYMYYWFPVKMLLSVAVARLKKSKSTKKNRPPKQPNEESSIFGQCTLLGFKFQQPLIYTNTILISVYHFLFLYAIVTYPWLHKWKLTTFSFFYGYCGGLGITAGVHRYFTHRSFKTNQFLKVTLLILYASAGHNKLFEWVRDHRVHHKYSETDADPHNSKRGFFFAHVGWLMMKKHPDVIKKGKTVDMSDITNDPLLVWFDRYFTIIKLFFCFILPTCIVHYALDETWYWSIMTQCFARYILLLNFTWLVNSAAHLYGNKPYDQNINPRENLLVSCLAVGEGWHNYHHAFPWDYKASEFGKLNVTTFLLNICGRLGWAYDFKYASDDLVKRTATKLGDGSHKKFEGKIYEGQTMK